jgi:hypothetical protein
LLRFACKALSLACGEKTTNIIGCHLPPAASGWLSEVSKESEKILLVGLDRVFG